MKREGQFIDPMSELFGDRLPFGNTITESNAPKSLRWELRRPRDDRQHMRRLSDPDEPSDEEGRSGNLKQMKKGGVAI